MNNDAIKEIVKSIAEAVGEDKLEQILDMIGKKCGVIKRYGRYVLRKKDDMFLIDDATRVDNNGGPTICVCNDEKNARFVLSALSGIDMTFFSESKDKAMKRLSDWFDKRDKEC